MKKLFFFAALLCSATLFAETELVDFSKITLDSYGDAAHGAPVVKLAGEVITAEIKGNNYPSAYQWDNQVKITLTNVASAGLSKDKEYKLSFTATASTNDCGGVTLKAFDNNQLIYRHQDIVLNTTPFVYESEWVKLADDAALTTNGTIVFAFGWDPAQTVTISKLSFKERAATTAIESVQHSAISVQKVIENGQLVIIKNGVRYDVTGAQMK